MYYQYISFPLYQTFLFLQKDILCFICIAYFQNYTPVSQTYFQLHYSYTIIFFSLKTCLHFLNCITLQLYFLYSTINLFLNLHLNFFYLNIFLVPTSTATIENEIRILLYGFLFLNFPEMLSFSPFSEFPVHYYVVINSEHTHTYTQT